MRLPTIVLNGVLATTTLALAACGGDDPSNPLSSTASSVKTSAAGKIKSVVKEATDISPSGTTIPSATQIIDSNDAVWTVLDGVVKLNDAPAGFSASVALLLYFDGVIYQQNAGGDWWFWSGAGWTASTDPRVSTATTTGSPSGTIIPTVPQITDGNGDVWTVAEGEVFKDGAPAGTSAGVTLLLYFNNAIYQYNIYGAWWVWNGSNWTLSKDPRTTASTGSTAVNGSCGLASGSTVTVAPTANLCVAGTASAVSGSGPYTWSCAGTSGGGTAACSATVAPSTSTGGSSSSGGPSTGTAASPSGTSVPAVASIVDSNGNVWTISAGAVLENGSLAGTSAGVIGLLYVNNVIYQNNIYGAWWAWSGSRWVLSNKPNGATPVGSSSSSSSGGSSSSSSGTTTTGSGGGTAGTSSSSSSGGSSSSSSSGGTTSSSGGTTSGNGAASPSGTSIPTVTKIIDKSGNVWTLSGSAVHENGALAGTSAGVTQVLYSSNVIYQYNIYGQWWAWSGTGWVLSSTPNGATTGTTTPTPPASTPGSGEKLSGDTSRPNNSTFVLGETVQLTFNVTGMAAAQSTQLNLNIADEYGNAISTQPVTLTSNSSGAATTTVTAPSAKLGYYRVNAALADGTTLSVLGTRPAGYISYAVVVDPATRVAYGDTNSHFGMQGGFSLAQGSVIPYLGIRYYLSTGGSWTGLESNHSGQFAEAVASASASGQVYPVKNPVVDAVTYNGQPYATYSVSTLASANIPSWAGPIAGTGGSICSSFGALNSAGVAGFPAFASALGSEVSVNYPAQSQHYYQVTWEPESPWCYGGTPSQLVQYYQLAYAALHNADSKAVVAGPTLFPGDGPTQLAALFSAGLGKYLDAVSMHPYVQFPPETNGLVTNIRSQMQMAANSAGHTLPFIGTEHGLTSGFSTTGEMKEALGDIRTTIILIGEGFKFDFDFYIADFWDHSPTQSNNTYGFYWNLNPAIDYGTNKIGPKMAAPAYSAMTYMLDGTTSQGQVSGLTGTQMGYRFTRNGTTILALWDYGSTSSTLNLNAPSGTIQNCDWMGNCGNTSGGSLSLTLSAAPIYLIGAGL